MIIKKSQATKEHISRTGFVLDYPMPSEDVGISIQNLDGRIPDSGYYKNNVCRETCFVINGSATVFIDSEVLKVSEGDIFIINPKQKSYVTAKKLKILVITQPNWYEEQCERIQK